MGCCVQCEVIKNSLYIVQTFNGEHPVTVLALSNTNLGHLGFGVRKEKDKLLAPCTLKGEILADGWKCLILAGI